MNQAHNLLCSRPVFLQTECLVPTGERSISYPAEPGQPESRKLWQGLAMGKEASYLKMGPSSWKT